MGKGIVCLNLSKFHSCVMFTSDGYRYADQEQEANSPGNHVSIAGTSLNQPLS
ncbi:hypothetical protein HOV93_47050 [Planctomycetes bacterium FF15]|uniref:Uncharacterized protein n=1 Tax=Bremerella alba TaxID=980252 RepID=A0A7V8VAD6_9BACT|nr:hypothetical protein [Bremerella alba]